MPLWCDFGTESGAMLIWECWDALTPPTPPTIGPLVSELLSDAATPL